MVTIDQIKEEISIVDALEQYTTIKIPNPNKRSISTKCPFHSDGKPSFVIYPRSNTFKCFTGCNDGRVGDVIDVVRLSKGIDHKEAIKTLVKDFKLSATGEEAEKWREKQKERKQNRKISKAIETLIVKRINDLKNLIAAIDQQLNGIKNIDDLDRLGNLYHAKVQIEYWLDCLIDENDYVKIGALEEVEKHLKGGDKT